MLASRPRGVVPGKASAMTESHTSTTEDGRPRPKVSGIITSFNEEHNIADCIESLLWCDEIVVVDSFSTDDTVTIARRYDKVRVLQRSYLGAASQKNHAPAVGKLRPGGAAFPREPRTARGHRLIRRFQLIGRFEERPHGGARGDLIRRQDHQGPVT